MFAYVLKLSGVDIGDVVWCGLLDVEVDHDSTGRRRVRRVETGEVEVVDTVWRVVG